MGWQAKDISYTPGHVKEPTAVKTNVTITKISKNSTNVRMLVTADRNGEVTRDLLKSMAAKTKTKTKLWVKVSIVTVQNILFQQDSKVLYYE